MADHELSDATSFKELERQGWGEKARSNNIFLLSLASPASNRSFR
jgi:hypothetical protein